MPAGVNITGNLLIPRRGNNAAAIFDSNCEDELTAVMLDLDITDVSAKSKPLLETLKEQTRLRQIFRSGFQIEVPLNAPKVAGLLKLGEEQPAKEGKKPKTDPVGRILKGDDIEGELANNLAKAGLIVQIEVEED